MECIVKIGRRKGQNINTDNLLDSNISYKKNQAVRERRQDEKRKCIFFFIILKGSSLQKCLSFFVLFCFFRTFKLFQLKKKTKPVHPFLLSLDSGNYQTVLSIYDLGFLGVFLDSTYKKNHMVFVFP